MRALLLKCGGYLLLLLVIAGCSATHYLPEQSTKYAASPIYFSNGNVHTVVKDFDAQLKVNAEDHAVYSVHKVVTISHPDAQEHSRLTLGYGGFQNILDVKGAIYSKEGKLIRYLNEEDGQDMSLSGGSSIYSDTRIKTYQLYHNAYPYTIVYDYTVEYTGLLNLPAFMPQNTHEFVKRAGLRVQSAPGINIRYHVMNINQKPQKRILEQDSVYSWEFTNLKPVKNEPFDPSFMEKAPRILLATQDFRMGNSTGSLESWDSFGQWYYSLSKGRGDLPPRVQQEVQAIYAAAPNRKQGIKALYEYMQEKTRYISIQLGIGGWQPFKASFVEENGYGDCKALTNYMQSILKYAGVPSYPVLIRNGVDEQPIITDFPGNQFNHVILYVPGDEPLWLETTSQSIPFNYIGNSNANRHGLLVKPDTSFLIKTPLYDHTVNKRVNNVDINIESSGNAKMLINSSYSGYYLDDILGNVAQKSDQEREQWLHQTIALNAFSIDSSDFKDVDLKKKVPVIRLNIEKKKYATRTGNRLFIPLNKLNKWTYQFPEMNGPRTAPVQFPFSFQEKDVTSIHLPEGFKLEAKPGDVQINTSFGSYRMMVSLNKQGNVEVTRNLKITQKEMQSEEYDDLRSFFAQIKSSDDKNIVLRLK